MESEIDRAVTLIFLENLFIICLIFVVWIAIDSRADELKKLLQDMRK